MTYEEIYDAALCRLHLEPSEVSDYRPASHMYINQIKEIIPNGIIIWLKSGESIIFVEKEK
jgi:hypothetical protein